MPKLYKIFHLKEESKFVDWDITQVQAIAILKGYILKKE